ncbi:Phospholipase D phosphatidylserine synthase type [Penicillium cf. griseofulvum]|uniref:CDP-diacylglycerol--glycerol-3-phosphate 3-phosphatidyltransferase n=1 Tax=Penicillium cf. griseofulvum TaxID=2972120 RepID=A0A9W9JS02_9EURO|nr:Phospholipase D phosphatidylserine synthase type [Penicillium cf. griseofulvum]KAJ5442773.1 Phospholipase D phosphatidylserine synthase type [Penicillium cf. griseofulvum]KAJ5451427.1 Phospholipase D phosphatidylserine synthase type [Penicillium cf. griseofulvum]
MDIPIQKTLDFGYSDMFGRIGGQTVRCAGRRPVARRRLCTRQFSAHTGTGAATAAPAPSPLAGITSELDRIAPRFEVPASHIHIIDSPANFYSTLKNKIRNARRRIYLSTLYIGKTEHDLVDTLSQALRSNPDLKVSILTDALRGTRETPNASCASLLCSLVEEYGPERVEIRMFHTPNLTGLRKKWIPSRVNEGWGLQHMKLYGIDDEIILSGANLSEEYFTSRLDRYHVFDSKVLTEYYAKIHHAVCSLSFQVLPDPQKKSSYILDWPTTNKAPSPLDDAQEFITHSSTLLSPLIQASDNKPALPSSSSQTYVYPVSQFTSLLQPDDTSTEYPAMTTILHLLSSSSVFVGARWLFTAGYFNMHPVLSSLMISSTTTASRTPTTTKGTVLTASPWANGFFGSSGVSGMLPAAYTHLAARFLDRVADAHATDSIQLKEWRKGTVGTPGGWTYHAKGLWITLPREEHPSLTFVGSSNYTKRSYSLDLESGAVVVTNDPALKQKLGEETERLQKNASPVSREDLMRTERRVGWNVRLSMWIVEKVGGAF